MLTLKLHKQLQPLLQPLHSLPLQEKRQWLLPMKSGFEEHVQHR